MAGVEDRVVARSQIILRDGKALEICKQRIDVFLLLQYDRPAKNLGEIPICQSYMLGENMHLVQNCSLLFYNKQLLLVRLSYIVSLSME